jgi:UDP-N-acetylglucosamine--N-acetylmuramyl-(pentapeptide) pyrophosphoryl-undecaprenol N-acetylglucosamine transferase
MGNPEGMEAKLTAGRAATRWPGCASRRCAARACCASCCCPSTCCAASAGLVQLRAGPARRGAGHGRLRQLSRRHDGGAAGVPLVLHEQNSVAGLANRVLAGVADRVLTGFPECARKGRWVGNPVRPEIAVLPAPAQRMPAHEGPLHVLVVGGSLGAQAAERNPAQGAGADRGRGAADGGAPVRRKAPADAEEPVRVGRRQGRIAWPSSRTWRVPTSGPTW